MRQLRSQLWGGLKAVMMSVGRAVGLGTIVVALLMGLVAPTDIPILYGDLVMGWIEHWNIDGPASFFLFGFLMLGLIGGTAVFGAGLLVGMIWGGAILLHHLTELGHRVQSE